MVAGYKVLIVDDDPAYTKSTQLVLESHGYEVESASSGDEALVEMRSNSPDLVLLDIMMDWALDGVNVTRQMLRDRELQGIPVIIVSSIVNSEYRDMFPQDEYLHCDYWLDKPCPPDVLVSRIENVLSRHKKHAPTTSGHTDVQESSAA